MLVGIANVMQSAVRTLMKNLSQIPETVPIQIELCVEQIEWAKESKRKFLRQRLESTLAELYVLVRLAVVSCCALYLRYVVTVGFEHVL